VFFLFVCLFVCLSVCLDTCHCAGYSKEDECHELPLREAQTEVTGTDNVKCNTPPTERRTLIEKVREKTETAKQRGKKLVHWLTPTTEGDDSAFTDERDNNNTGMKEPPAVLAR
jgi:hypothetical protein